MTPVLQTCKMPPKKRAARHRRWVFTEYQVLDKTELSQIADALDPVWLIAGLETCTTDRHHLQGALILKNPQSLQWLKDNFLPTAHFEIMAGQPKDSKAYCSKEDSEPLVMGTMPQQGQRSDLMSVKESIDSGATEKSLWEDHFQTMIKYQPALKRYKLCTAKPRNPETTPTILIVTGPSGSGKTKQMPPPSEDCYWHSLGKWWDGYSGQTSVVFDEFYGQLPYNYMLRIIDRHPMTVELKGATCQLAATNFYFTSNLDWDDWWTKAQADGSVNISAFRRRVEEWGRVIKIQ